MAFPLHLDIERIMLEFDSTAFKAGEAIAPGLIGGIALARLSGNDSMKPFWLKSTPNPSIHSQDTSTSSFYSAVNNIETPWRPCVILDTIMNPWHVGIEIILLPIVRVNYSSACYNHLVDNPAWAPISPNKATNGSFVAVETNPPWFNSRSFIGIGLPFKLRCLAKKAHITCLYRLSSKDLIRLQSFRLPKGIIPTEYNNTLPPYPFPWIIDHYGELGTFTEGHLSAGCKWDDLGAWKREHLEIATFLKHVLDAGNQPTHSDSLDASAAHQRLPVFDSVSECTVYRLVAIISTSEFRGLLSPHDCSALSLTHPCLTRPAQKLMLHSLSITSVSQAQRALEVLTAYPDLLVLLETLTVDARSYHDKIALSTFLSLVSLVSPWVINIDLQAKSPANVLDLFDAMGLTTGITKLTLGCAPCQQSESLDALLWPPFWMMKDGFWNLVHVSLSGLTISFNNDDRAVSCVHSLKLDHCHLQYSDPSDGSAADNDVSLVEFMSWWRTTLRYLELNAVTGITQESVEEAIRLCKVLQHIKIIDTCPQADSPVSLRTALADKKFDAVEVIGSGFTDFEDYPHKVERPSHVWYGDREDWDLYGERTHHDYWIYGLHLYYTDGGDYAPFESEDSY